MPSNIKDSENLNIFKANIKSWKPENCPSHLFRLYIAGMGFPKLQLILLINYNLFKYINFVLVVVDFCQSMYVWVSFCVYNCAYLSVHICACAFMCITSMCVHIRMCVFVFIYICMYHFFPVAMKLKIQLEFLKQKYIIKWNIQ